MTSRSVWQSPAAFMRTSTSLCLSPSAITVSTFSGVCGACKTAARYSMLIGAFSLRCSGGRLLARIFLDHLRTLLADHDRRRVCVAGRHCRHDGRVDDAEPGDTVHTQPRIDDRHRVGAHLAGADGVKDVGPGVAGELGELRLADDVRSRNVSLDAIKIRIAS